MILYMYLELDLELRFCELRSSLRCWISVATGASTLGFNLCEKKCDLNIILPNKIKIVFLNEQLHAGIYQAKKY